MNRGLLIQCHSSSKKTSENIQRSDTSLLLNNCCFRMLLCITDRHIPTCYRTSRMTGWSFCCHTLIICTLNTLIPLYSTGSGFHIHHETDCYLRATSMPTLFHLPYWQFVAKKNGTHSSLLCHLKSTVAVSKLT